MKNIKAAGSFGGLIVFFLDSGFRGNGGPGVFPSFSPRLLIIAPHF